MSQSPSRRQSAPPVFGSIDDDHYSVSYSVTRDPIDLRFVLLACRDEFLAHILFQRWVSAILLAQEDGRVEGKIPPAMVSRKKEKIWVHQLFFEAFTDSCVPEVGSEAVQRINPACSLIKNKRIEAMLSEIKDAKDMIKVSCVSEGDLIELYTRFQIQLTNLFISLSREKRLTTLPWMASLDLTAIQAVICFRPDGFELPYPVLQKLTDIPGALDENKRLVYCGDPFSHDQEVPVVKVVEALPVKPALCFSPVSSLESPVSFSFDVHRTKPTSLHGAPSPGRYKGGYQFG